MYKAKSVPKNLNETDCIELTENLSKSPSYDSLIDICKRFKIEFEGDGPLGIRFTNIDEKLVVSKIEEGTVADEYIKLKEDLVVKSVNNINAKFYNYDGMMKILRKIWKKESRVTIEFSEEIVYKHVYNYLDDIDCSKYYDLFIELGAKDLSDLRYVEYNDLVKMNICYEDRRKLSIKLGLKYNLVIPKNESEIFEFESPTTINREQEKIDILRNQLFNKKEKDHF